MQDSAPPTLLRLHAAASGVGTKLGTVNRALADDQPNMTCFESLVLESVAQELQSLAVLCDSANDIVGNALRNVRLDLERYCN